MSCAVVFNFLFFIFGALMQVRVVIFFIFIFFCWCCGGDLIFVDGVWCVVARLVLGWLWPAYICIVVVFGVATLVLDIFFYFFLFFCSGVVVLNFIFYFWGESGGGVVIFFFIFIFFW